MKNLTAARNCSSQVSGVTWKLSKTDAMGAPCGRQGAGRPGEGCLAGVDAHSCHSESPFFRGDNIVSFKTPSLCISLRGRNQHHLAQQPPSHGRWLTSQKGHGGLSLRQEGGEHIMTCQHHEGVLCRPPGSLLSTHHKPPQRTCGNNPPWYQLPKTTG